VKLLAHDTIVCVENTLVKSGKCLLPGKEAFYGSEEGEIEMVLVDVAESLVEWPKKPKEGAIAAKRNVVHKKRSYLSTVKTV
jgi:hypothetical protein